MPFDDYIELFNLSPENMANIDVLLKTELFTTYKKDFDNSTDIKNLKKKKFFKDKNQPEKELEINKRFIQHLYAIEKDKLYYFILAFQNPQKVLIVKSPSNNKAQKKFLGYEWSSAKGNEGIKYIGGSTINDMITPLFNSMNLADNTKINTLIEKNFLGEQPNDLSAFEDYKEFISYANVQDILDFSRKDFNKTFSLTPKKNIVIESKWEQVKLGNHVETNPSKKEISHLDKNTKVSFIEMSSVSHNGYISKKIEKTIRELQKGGFTYFKENDILIAKITPSMENGKCALAKNLTNNIGLGSTEFHVLRVKEVLLSGYLFVLLNRNSIRIEAEKKMTGSSGHRRVPIEFYENIKIPLPPKEVQEKIVQECATIDQEVAQAKKTIDEAKKGIAEEIKKVFEKGYEKKTLGKICELKAGKFVSASDIKEDKSECFYPCFGGNGLRGYTKTFTHIGTYSLIGRQGALCGNVHKVSGTFHATEHAVVATPHSGIDTNWLYYMLAALDLNKYATGMAQPGLSIKNILPILIPVPPLSDQKILVDKIEKLETKITQAQAILETSPEKKQRILDQYLK